LKALGERNDIIKTMHRALADHRVADEERGHIVSLDPVPTKAEPRYADLNIHAMAEANDGIDRPSKHLEVTRCIIERRHGDRDAFIRSHVRRLEALRRASHVERIDAHYSAQILRAHQAHERDRRRLYRERFFV